MRNTDKKPSVGCGTFTPHEEHTWVMYCAVEPLVYYCRGVQGVLLEADEVDILTLKNLSTMARKYGYSEEALRNRLLNSNKTVVLTLNRSSHDSQ